MPSIFEALQSLREAMIWTLPCVLIGAIFVATAYLIEITNLSFDLILRPDPASPHLNAIRKKAGFYADATISGSFLTLIGMIDGRFDGDALFFTRDLQISGDTEAIVCLRNALDDIDGSVASEAASYFGPIGVQFLTILRKVANEHQYST